MQTMVYGAAGIITAGMIIAGFFVGGLYVVTPMARYQGDGRVLIVGRFTGSVMACDQTFCRPVRPISN